MQALGLYESTSRKTVLALSIEQTDIEAGSGSSKAKQERIALVCFPSWKLSGTVTWWKETSSGHCFCFQVNYILGFDIPFGVLCIQSESRLQWPDSDPTLTCYGTNPETRKTKSTRTKALLLAVPSQHLTRLLGAIRKPKPGTKLPTT
ncbi:hypothetical protein Y1Q_0015085 [Alligator mississippiensis]|uniref:Uncharacterized protein n=1 Tax=Alligator mississippiensis TaxID=8496 RepID=A0A151P8R0_ALLMI|nr:hypothetical protein Y1Q_0015085 [Alligator mississippiensis]